MIVQSAAELFPVLMAKPRAGELLDLGLATTRGFALLTFTGDPDDVDRRWRRARRNLLLLYDGLSD
jgi:hypothetical protein